MKLRIIEPVVLAGAMAGMLAVVVNLRGDIAGFLVPVLVLAWPIAALGLDAIRSVAAPLGRAAPLLSAAVALSLPCARLVANEPQVLPFRRVDDAASFRALYASLPAGAAVVYENYWTEMVMTYLHLSGEIAPDPSPALVSNTTRAARAALAEGRRLFAFPGSASWLEANGLSFQPADLAAPALASWLRELPRGTRVAVATSGRALPYELVPADAHGTRLSRPRPFGVMTWIVGRRSFVANQDDSAAVLSAALPQRWWRSGTASHPTMEIGADGAGARVVMGPDRFEVPIGTVVVTVRPDGTIQRRLSYTGHASLTVPSLVPVMAFDDEVACETLQAGTPVNVSRVLDTGGWLTTTDRMGTSTVDLLFSESAAAAVRQRVTRGHGTVDVEQLGPGRTRLVLARIGWQRPVFRLTAGSGRGAVLATLASGGAVDRLRVCALSPPAIVKAGSVSGDISTGAEADDYFGAGWHEAERTGGMRFRWAERKATLLLPMSDAVRIEAALRLSPASATGATVQASMNEWQAGSCELAPGAWTTCRFTVRADAIRAGVNRLTLTSTTSVAPDGGVGERRELAFSTQGGTLRILR